MNKMITIAIVVLGFSILASANLPGAVISPNAIGLRLGGGFGVGGAEISYQRASNFDNRLEMDLGWYTGSTADPYRYWSQLGLAGIYQWDWNITDGLNWYVGPGAAVNIYSGNYDNDNSGIGLSVGGQIGIEYNFESAGAPILLSLDVRPMWGFLNNGGGGGDGAFSIRYTY